MCAKATESAEGFFISGLLDSGSSTRSRYPVVEIDVSRISDHPDNAAYSMDEEGIERLADAIRREGLTDIPLVRKLSDGSWQMLSGHRRKAAYAFLAKDDPAFAKMPCRVVESISDEHALALLHTANLFTRELSATERAAATKALGLEVKRLREDDPGMRGRRTEDIKADIISAQTGKAISGKTVRRQEATADKITSTLSPGWAKAADANLLSAHAVELLADMDAGRQEALFAKWANRKMDKRDITALIENGTDTDDDKPDRRLVTAESNLRRYASDAHVASPADSEALASIWKTLRAIRREA